MAGTPAAGRGWGCVIYGSHAMRKKGFPLVDGLSTDPWVLGRRIRGFERFYGSLPYISNR